MKILQLTPRMPYPLTDGGAIAVYNITKWHALLGHEVTLATYPLDTPEETAEAVNDLSRYAKLHLVSKPLPPRWWVLLRTMFRGAYPIERRQMKEMYDLIDRLIREEQFDIVHIDHAQMGAYGLWIKAKYGLPMILRENNFEALIYERFSRMESNPIKKYLAWLHGRRLKREETKFLNGFDAVAAISDEDVEVMKRVAPRGRYSVIPAGVDIDYFSPQALAASTAPVARPDPNSIVSVGSMAWDPNFDAIRYFLRSIFPLILKERPETVLDIVGGAEERIKPYTRSFGGSVRVHGRVPDVRDYLARSTVLVVPLRIGGGMRIKILEFFAAGKAVVSTSIGAEGNRGKDGVHILIRDSEQAFANGVLELLSDPARRESLGQHARELIVSRYSWEQVVRDFTALYEEVLARRR